MVGRKRRYYEIQNERDKAAEKKRFQPQYSQRRKLPGELEHDDAYSSQSAFSRRKSDRCALPEQSRGGLKDLNEAVDELDGT